MARALVLTAIGAVLLTAAGCGGDDDESAADDQTPTATMEVTTAETVVDDAASFASTENCRELLSLGARLAEALAGSGGDVDRTKEIVTAYAEQAPEEIRAAFRVIADAYDEIAEAIGDVDVAPGETPSPETLEKLQQAAAGIDQGAVAKASADIAAWVEANC